MLYAAAKDWARFHAEEVPPPGFSHRSVTWQIGLDRDGRLKTGPVKLERQSRNQARLLADVSRTSGTKPILVHDKTSYVLPPHVTGNNAESEHKQLAKRTARHAAYRELLDECVADTGDRGVAAVRTFVSSLPVGYSWDGLGDDDPVQFVVDGSDPVVPGSVAGEWWSARSEGQTFDGEQVCLVCGALRPALRLLPSLKGLLGTSSAEAPLTSSNVDVFERHGRSKGNGSPICPTCAHVAHGALNFFLRDEDHHANLAGSSMVWWVPGPAPAFNLAAILDADDGPAELRARVERFRAGKQTGGTDHDRFCAVLLTANAGRVAVASWIDTTVADIESALGRWFTRVSMTDGHAVRSPTFFQMAAAVLPPQQRIDWKPVRRLTTRLLDAALTGSHPAGVVAAVLNRTRANRNVRHAHAALLKLALCPADWPNPEEFMTALDPDNPSPAYQCGRLLSVVASIQYAALGRTNATVVDRYYGSASSRPATVLGSLVRGAQPHLAKVRKTNPGRAVNLERRLGDVLDHLPAIPATLNLADQAEFTLGYYHQRQHDFSRGDIPVEPDAADPDQLEAEA